MGNEYIEAARVFHEITKHSYTSVRASPHFLDWDNKPMPYKIYPGAASVALPRDLNLSSTPTLAALSSYMPAEFSAAIDTAALTRILFCADGLTRQKRVGDDDYHFRAAASAGALYPIEIYVAASEVDGLETGLYHFSPADLRMTGLRRGDWRGYIASRGGEASFDSACAGGDRDVGDLLAQRMEVSRAGVSLLLLGRGNYPGEYAGSGGGRGNLRRSDHRVR